MKWLLVILIVLIALLSLDYSNALWETRQSRKDLQGFTLVKEGFVKNIYAANSSCSPKSRSCFQIAVDISYEHEQERLSETTVYLRSFPNGQVGQSIPLLCDTTQNMCLPKDFVYQRRSIWLATYLSRLWS